MRCFRLAINAVTSWVGFLRRGRRVRAGGRIVKVNLGCGLAIAPGWINVDGSLNAFFSNWPSAVRRMLYRLSGASQFYTLDQYLRLLGENAFVHHDLAYGVPFEDSSVDFIFTSHFLEHLPRETGAALLKESFRALKPGGLVRVCVPDLRHAIGLYEKGLAEKMMENYFFTGDGNELSRHKYMYDFELLSGALRAAGFAEIRRCEYRRGSVPDLETLDNRPDETLFVEARKMPS